MIQTIMPFVDRNMEQDFLLSYNRRRAMLDLFVACYLSYHRAFCVKQTAYPILWAILCIGHALVVVASFHHGFPGWRQHVIVALRLLGFVVLFLHVRDKINTASFPSFASAAYHAMINLSRFKLPLFSAVLAQIPLRQGHILLHTFIVLFLLSHSWEECLMMVDANPDFASLAAQLEGNYSLWKSAGTIPACQDMCRLLGKDGSICVGVCRMMLPGVWHLYGPPWAHACAMHRLIIVVGAGYIAPMLVPYTREMMERHEFAKERGLHVADVRTCWYASAPAVGKEVLTYLLTGVLVLSGS
eukprot:jgi/Botrbrau1/3595/Bobra.0078s0046.1